MSRPARTRVAVLISGRGSNLGALLKAAADPAYPAEIVLVVSSKPDAAGLDLAREAGVATAVIEPGPKAERAASEQDLDEAIRAAGASLICLAGYMHILSSGFVERWQDRILNIHPSLLPAFRGLDTHERALAAGVRFHGCTVHFVRPEVDTGPIVAQAAVRVAADDTADTLAERVLEAEHALYSYALAMVAGGRIQIEGNRVRVEGFEPTPRRLSEYMTA